jgi:HTH-type transcriptional regulator / antitoxin HipB
MYDLGRAPTRISAVIQRAHKQQDYTQSDLADHRQGTNSVIEKGDKPKKLDAILPTLAALDLEFRVVRRSKGAGQDIEELF